MINQSLQIFQTLTGIFGGKKDGEAQRENQEKDLAAAMYENEDSSQSHIYDCVETEQEAFDNKMHPTKIVEKNWVDGYKLAQLIEQQEKWLGSPPTASTDPRDLFGGVSHMQLDSAFAFIRCNSSTGLKSPIGAASRVPPIRIPNDQ